MPDEPRAQHSEHPHIPRPERDIMHFLIHGPKKQNEFSTIQIQTTQNYSVYQTTISGELNNSPVSLKVKTEKLPPFGLYYLSMLGTIGDCHVVESYNTSITPKFIDLPPQ